MSETAAKPKSRSTKLDVPFYSQYDRSHGFDDYWGERVCGIMSLKMVFDYWRAKSEQPTLPAQEIFRVTNVVGSRNSAGNILHSTLVMTARQYGFTAWRRGWVLSEDGRSRFEAEGADDETLAQIDHQHRQEAYPSLAEALRQGCPVLVSFSPARKHHLVVLTGYQIAAEGRVAGFYYHDPEKKDPEGKHNFVELAEFTEKWYSQGVFIIPESLHL